MGAEAYSEVIDGQVVVLEEGLDRSLAGAPQIREIARTISMWANDIRSNASRGGLLERQMFSPPPNVYSEIRAAREAVRTDDVVSGVAEITEAFAFQGGKADSGDEDTNDVFNQWNALVDMDSVTRKFWREVYGVNQFACAVQWGTHDFELRGKPKVDESGRRSRPGRRSSKYAGLKVPTKIAVLDPTCVLPVQSGPLGEESLLWSASDAEIRRFDEAEKDNDLDPDMNNFFLGRYNPLPEEVARFKELGFGSTDRLLIMNPKYVTRFTGTKSDYDLFPDVRLKSVFDLLDLKRQLMIQDRVLLIGAANFIVLIKKGDEKQPATPAEMENLKDNYRVMAKLPIIISDHRLSIEIIAPKTDLVLNSEKYDLIDSRLLSRLLGTLSIGGKGQRNETNVTMSYAVARNMENRRHMLRRFIEKTFYQAIVDENPGVFPEAPKYVYTPAKIALGFDQALGQLMQTLHETRNISRETMLEFVGLDQDTEALRKLLEKEQYDGKVFDQTLMPGQTDPSQPPGATPDGRSAQGNGATGGRPPGTPGQTPAPKSPTAPKKGS